MAVSVSADRFIAAVTAAFGLWASLSAAQSLPVAPAVAQRASIDEYLDLISPEFARHVAPTAQPPFSSLNADPQSDLPWTEAALWRLDQPEPPPPVVPPGLAALAWSLANPADIWRIVLPIPPEQTPELIMPADLEWRKPNVIKPPQAASRFASCC